MASNNLKTRLESNSESLENCLNHFDDSFPLVVKKSKYNDIFDQVRQLPSYNKCNFEFDPYNVSLSETSINCESVSAASNMDNSEFHKSQFLTKSLNVSLIADEENNENTSSEDIFLDNSPLKQPIVSTPIVIQKSAIKYFPDVGVFEQSLEDTKNLNVASQYSEKLSASFTKIETFADENEGKENVSSKFSFCNHDHTYSCNGETLQTSKEEERNLLDVPTHDLRLNKSDSHIYIEKFKKRAVMIGEDISNSSIEKNEIRNLSLPECSEKSSNSDSYIFKDQKLQCEPRVVLDDYLSVLGIEYSFDYKSVDCCRGFNNEEVAVSQNQADLFSSLSCFNRSIPTSNVQWQRSTSLGSLKTKELSSRKSYETPKNKTDFKSKSCQNLNSSTRSNLYRRSSRFEENFKTNVNNISSNLKNCFVVLERNSFCDVLSQSCLNDQIDETTSDEDIFEDETAVNRSSTKNLIYTTNSHFNIESANTSQSSVINLLSVTNDDSSDNNSIISIHSSSEEAITILSSSTCSSDNDIFDDGYDNEKLDNISNINEINKQFSFAADRRLSVKPGKLWRRSLNILRKSSAQPSLSDRTCCINSCVEGKENPRMHKRLTVRIVPDAEFHNKNFSRLSYLARYASTVIEEYSSPSKQLPPLTVDKPIEVYQRCSTEFTARDLVLHRCRQTKPFPFFECYPDVVLQTCHKIGEGVYGEVFLFEQDNVVMKIIPIEGDQMVNGEHQKKFEEILTEIVIASELSSLRNGRNNRTSGFSEVRNIRCLQGCYPSLLIREWEIWDEIHGSENDSPAMFKKDQLYIVLELVNGGKDMEAFVFNNAQQAYSLFQQTACALAVAESALQFEHRDLHWGNVLISQIAKTAEFKYTLNDNEIIIPSNGVKINIIDFTLSRITCDNVLIYNDLALDKDLFTASGDYQFDIYRLMKDHNKNQWCLFTPYTNVLWLDYLLDKVISQLRYKNTRSKTHKNFIDELRKIKRNILHYKSATNFVIENFL